ncbi:MAG: DEAD/DEAH box helicase family protein, partial [Alphaproteobacteria bacterium]
MSAPTNSGTRDIPLKFAKGLTDFVNAEWASGKFLDKVSPITADLLRYWFDQPFCDIRSRNFHDGQRQAILNTIYVHEVLKSKSVFDTYTHLSEATGTSYADSGFTQVITGKEYSSYPKYCVKMATGTGKTWVLNALLIWQYLNAKYQTNNETTYTKNFLLVAPGLIVYERLLDAFRGKEIKPGERDFNTSDLKSNEELFIPEKYRQDVFSFVQNSVADKTEIGHKTTGDGIIAITNWHVLAEDEPEEEPDVQTVGVDFAETKQIASDILPVAPGVAAGNALDALDAKYLRGGILEYLANLPNLCVFNDEAHHIHINKTNGVVTAVVWQKALNTIAEPKGNKFTQIDFSATPYSVTGGGKNRTKNFFPHIVTNFELATAMKAGFVKTFILDKRKELGALSNAEIEFKALRDDNKKCIGLSEGQRLMLRAGLSRLNILCEDFKQISTKKSPKMLVVCEDTDVSPFVVDFLRSEGLAEDDIMRIDSNKKGEIPAEEWEQTKQQLFNMDKSDKPKVVVSVMMLREGFDVNSICVIVPLRSSEAPILLEQVLGRGLRLMWREPEFQDSKAENRHNIYDLKQKPVNYLDTLFVVEHPAFEKFYDDLDKSLLVEESNTRPGGSKKSLGDMTAVGLKPNYQDLDLFWP